MTTSKKSTNNPDYSATAPINTEPYEEAPLEGASASVTSEQSEQNVAPAEKTFSTILGTALGIFGTRQLMKKNWLSGGSAILSSLAFLKRGVTGKCELYSALGINTAEKAQKGTKGFRVQESVVINCDVQEIYTFWRNLENLPQIMRHLKSVETLDTHTSHWIAEAPLGIELEWDAEIVLEEENGLIAWKSLAGSEILTEGKVKFEQLADEDRTRVTVDLQYHPPGGAVSLALAKFFGRDAQGEIQEDLEIFKHYMESGAFPWDEQEVKREERVSSPSQRMH